MELVRVEKEFGRRESCQIVRHSSGHDKVVVINESVRMWKETIMSLFNVL
jgi:hypothetical protein